MPTLPNAFLKAGNGSHKTGNLLGNLETLVGVGGRLVGSFHKLPECGEIAGLQDATKIQNKLQRLNKIFL